MAKENARPLKTEKTSAPSKAQFTEQGRLFEAPLLEPSWPNPGTLDRICLEMLLSGQCLTHPSFQAVTQSWRLAACIERLIKRHRWPIEHRDIPHPSKKRRNSEIREYWMRADAIELVKGGAVCNG
jgi:hypothetical protein